MFLSLNLSIVGRGLRWGGLMLVASIAAANPSTVPPTTVAIWTGGEDGVNVYTIPGLLVTQRGTVIAYAEARHEGRGDGGKVDLVIKRSLDGGRTWTRSFFIERAQADENYVLATIVQDRTTDRIFFFAALRNEGLTDTTTTNTYRFSDDDGASWSSPHDITSVLYAADEDIQRQIRAGTAPAAFEGEDASLFGRKLIFFGPGRSIQLSSDHATHPNRLVVPLFYIKDRIIKPRAKRGYGDAVLVSDDHGKTWFVAGTAPLGDHGSSEVSVVELEDGRLVMNARAAPPESSGMVRAGRTVSFSHDAGASWTTPVPDTSGIPLYIETSSGLLNYSIGRIDPTGTSRILFSFPLSQTLESSAQPQTGVHGRNTGTVLLSYDGGQSWAVQKEIVPGSFGYSNLDKLPDNTIVVIHENATGTVVCLTRFSLDWLTDGRDSIIGGPQ